MTEAPVFDKNDTCAPTRKLSIVTSNDKSKSKHVPNIRPIHAHTQDSISGYFTQNHLYRYRRNHRRRANQEKERAREKRLIEALHRVTAQPTVFY